MEWTIRKMMGWVGQKQKTFGPEIINKKLNIPTDSGPKKFMHKEEKKRFQPNMCKKISCIS